MPLGREPHALVRQSGATEYRGQRRATGHLARGQVDEVQLVAHHDRHSIADAEQILRILHGRGLPQRRAVGDVQTVQLIRVIRQEDHAPSRDHGSVQRLRGLHRVSANDPPTAHLRRLNVRLVPHNPVELTALGVQRHYQTVVGDHDHLSLGNRRHHRRRNRSPVHAPPYPRVAGGRSAGKVPLPLQFAVGRVELQQIQHVAVGGGHDVQRALRDDGHADEDHVHQHFADKHFIIDHDLAVGPNRFPQ